jgi:hypothetical protein
MARLEIMDLFWIVDSSVNQWEMEAFVYLVGGASHLCHKDFDAEVAPSRNSYFIPPLSHFLYDIAVCL